MLYIRILDKWGKSPRPYAPDLTWVTVVIGNLLIGLSFLLFAILGEISLRAFWLLVALNFAWGLPVIIWQEYARMRRIAHTLLYAQEKEDSCGNAPRS
jgi:hypothetical protein